MKYIYGPVQSRRLGLSLGLSLTEHKICNFNCVYCQLGKTITKASERKEYVSSVEIIAELEEWFRINIEEAKKLKYITLSGSGEPTLNIRIGQIIGRIKKITSIPVAVITNASLLCDLQVRRELLAADLIVPSLDAVSERVFKNIDRPGAGVRAEEIISGLINLRKEFRGEIWLEVMLVKGINDNLDEARKLKEVVDKISPDKIQLNSPVRTTSEPGILPVDRNRLEEFKEILGDKCEII